MLQCKVCNIEFVYAGPRGRNYQALTCSKSCCSALLSARNAANRVNELVASNCEICGKEIVNAITCSKACHGKRLSLLYSGRKLTEEWKSNQSRSKVREAIVKHGDYECEKCDKKFETNTSLRAHKSYCSASDGVKEISCHICSKVLKSERGLKIHMHCHDLSWNEPRKEKLRKAAQGRESQSTSRSELDFYDKLKNFFGEPDVVHKFKIDGVSHEYDFFIPSKNLIVEFDGDYWHGNSRIYSLTPRMKKQYYIDRNWDEKAAKSGYSIKRIWESESKEFQLETL